MTDEELKALNGCGTFANQIRGMVGHQKTMLKIMLEAADRLDTAQEIHEKCKKYVWKGIDPDEVEVEVDIAKAPFDGQKYLIKNYIGEMSSCRWVSDEYGERFLGLQGINISVGSAIAWMEMPK